MNKTGLVGQHIEHSFLPRLHNAAYEELGLDWEYGLYPCETVADFEALIKTAKREGTGFIGLSVTAPYKRDANRVAIGRSQDAALIQAANALTFGAGVTRSYAGVFADNTDGLGFAAMLRQANIELAGEKAVICGSGPVALSVLLELAKTQVGAVTILSRMPEPIRKRAFELLRVLGEARYLKLASSRVSGNRGEMVRLFSNMNEIRSKFMPQIDVTALAYDQAMEALKGAAVLINATPLGMHLGDPTPVPAALLRPDLAVLDVVCGNGKTALVEAAHAIGAFALDGMEMLVEQTALTIELWASTHGQRLTAPREAMRQAVQV
ncbi:MAG: hypothetical protein LBS58_01900 [Coriobacteriales bacterium]|jgi:shikimate dehydrogenase|nr:hypothetical protein [Coriobacteriales bacterium]